VTARRPTILVVDDARPRNALGAGHPRGLLALRALASIGSHVHLIATQGRLGEGLPEDPLPPNVSVECVEGTAMTRDALLARAPQFDVIWVARPNNMAAVDDARRRAPGGFARARIVYYAESIFALREIRRLGVAGSPPSEVASRRLVRKELVAAECASVVAAATPAERDVLSVHLRVPVEVLGHAAEPALTPATFEARSGVLFVGTASPADSPNGDSLRLLLATYWPTLGREAPRLAVIGRGTEPQGWLGPLAGSAIDLVGVVDDLAPYYERARMFVAPTRYGAGLPVKVLEAARHGLPVVATPLVAELLGWRDGKELLVADDAEAFTSAVRRLDAEAGLWQKIREGALAALCRDHSPARFESTVRRLVLDTAVGGAG